MHIAFVCFHKIMLIKYNIRIPDFVCVCFFFWSLHSPRKYISTSVVFNDVCYSTRWIWENKKSNWKQPPAHDINYLNARISRNRRRKQIYLWEWINGWMLNVALFIAITEIYICLIQTDGIVWWNVTGTNNKTII